MNDGLQEILCDNKKIRLITIYEIDGIQKCFILTVRYIAHPNARFWQSIPSGGIQILIMGNLVFYAVIIWKPNMDSTWFPLCQTSCCDWNNVKKCHWYLWTLNKLKAKLAEINSDVDSKIKIHDMKGLKMKKIIDICLSFHRSTSTLLL